MTIKFWRVGCGDAISIRFRDEGGNFRNVFIDSGYVGTYKNTIKKELLSIKSTGEKVGLWVITHTDRDHIGGVEAFIKDPTITNKEELIDVFWFNWSSYAFNLLQSEISVAQGIGLRDYLISVGKLRQEEVVANGQAIEWGGLTITVLSPDAESLKASKREWQEVEMRTQVSTSINDYSEPIETLLKQTFVEDADPWNGGSIAFVLSKGPKRILFLADSHPSVVIASLKRLGYTRNKKLAVDYVKLSHHGSKRNFNPELLEIVDCSNFIILANGVTHSLPNKWTLAQIIGSAHRSSRTIQFYFNDDTPQLRSIFAQESDIEKYRFSCHYNNDSHLTIQLS